MAADAAAGSSVDEDAKAPSGHSHVGSLHPRKTLRTLLQWSFIRSHTKLCGLSGACTFSQRILLAVGPPCHVHLRSSAGTPHTILLPCTVC